MAVEDYIDLLIDHWPEEEPPTCRYCGRDIGFEPSADGKTMVPMNIGTHTPHNCRAYPTAAEFGPVV